MSVDLSNVKVGTRVRLEDGSVHEIYIVNDGNTELPVCIKVRGWYRRDGTIPGGWKGWDIIEIIPDEKPKGDTCLWSYDREENGRTIWKTSCGYEFDHLQGDEQPRKHLCMEYCPYCGNEIKDMTTDC